jgi:hypothetical protein
MVVAIDGPAGAGKSSVARARKNEEQGLSEQRVRFEPARRWGCDVVVVLGDDQIELAPPGAVIARDERVAEAAEMLERKALACFAERPAGVGAGP